MGLFDFLKKKDAAPGEDPRLPELLARLADPDPAARIAACRALGELGPAAAPATERLQDLLSDDDGDVCNAAAAAMSEIER